MPTKSNENILDRDLSRVAAKELIDVVCPLLQEAINYSTDVILRCASSKEIGEPNEDFACFFLLHHVMKMTDAVEILLSQSCVIPAKPCLRSSFEALLSLEYILEDESKYIQRSLAWLSEYVRTRLARYEMYDLSTPRGKTVKARLKNDKILGSMKSGNLAIIRAAKAGLEPMLDRPEFADIEAEYGRLKITTKRRPDWHQLFGGPANIEGLATYLKLGGVYDLLYRDLSGITHAIDASDFYTAAPDKKSARILPLRDPSQMKATAVIALRLICRSTEVMLGRFRPTEDSFPKWYIKEIAPTVRILFP